jgi:hypothetical protein
VRQERALFAGEGQRERIACALSDVHRRAADGDHDGARRQLIEAIDVLTLGGGASSAAGVEPMPRAAVEAERCAGNRLGRAVPPSLPRTQRSNRM